MTRIAELLAAGPTYSFEFFPPKNDKELATLARTISELQPLEPSFVSVTYRGGAESRQRTVDLVSGMLHTTNLNPMAHIICVAHTRLELADILVSLRKAGVENLMALGGDPPEDPAAGPGELAYATELVELAHAIGGFSIGVAAHPAGHPRSPDLPGDRDHLAAKLALADFGVTQFFFEASEYVSLVADVRERGVDTPVLPGILPVTSLSTMGRLGAMGAAAPAWMQDRLRAADERGGADAVRKEGVELATELCSHLLDSGVPGLHFYTFNTSSATREIYAALGPGAEHRFVARSDRGRPVSACQEAAHSTGRRRSLALDRVATHAGAIAMRLAPTRTPTVIAATRSNGRTVSGMTPRLFAKAFHTVRPTTRPSGTPMTTPTPASVVACQDTVDTICPLTKPSTFSRPISRRRRDTLTTRRCASVAAPKTASMAPKMSGKLTASPKFTREVGARGSEAIGALTAR